MQLHRRRERVSRITYRQLQEHEHLPGQLHRRQLPVGERRDDRRERGSADRHHHMLLSERELLRPDGCGMLSDVQRKRARNLLVCPMHCLQPVRPVRAVSEHLQLPLIESAKVARTE